MTAVIIVVSVIITIAAYLLGRQSASRELAIETVERIEAERAREAEERRARAREHLRSIVEMAEAMKQRGSLQEIADDLNRAGGPSPGVGQPGNPGQSGGDPGAGRGHGTE